MGERTGPRVLYILWSYVMEHAFIEGYQVVYSRKRGRYTMFTTSRMRTQRITYLEPKPLRSINHQLVYNRI
ncbi:hypothetical protein HD806DRAFT_513792 [Xylariaceae sp. AK1471]|nr:hypothetical protein HD806DRAFT_513792 [Xylariaceae sp. AK1471]